MKYGTILLLVAMPISLWAQKLKFDKGVAVNKMCGRVTDSEFTSTPWASSEILGPGLPKKADVRLYRREGKGKCCPSKALVSAISTGNSGGFEFNDSVPGEYWLVVVVGKRNYKLAVSFDPRSQETSHECSDVVFQIHGEELRLLRMYKAYQLSENAQNTDIKKFLIGSDFYGSQLPGAVSCQTALHRSSPNLREPRAGQNLGGFREACRK